MNIAKQLTPLYLYSAFPYLSLSITLQISFEWMGERMFSIARPFFFFVILDCLQDSIGSSYIGTRSTTASGKTCRRWDSPSSFPASLFPDATVADAGNYCRNPSNLQGGPFCLTTDPLVPLETCGLQLCGRDLNLYPAGG